MNHYVYVGTYTQLGRGQGHRPEGIYRFLFNQADGSLAPAGTTRDTLNPSFLAIHPSRRFLYAANELSEGAVSAFAIQPDSGELSFINSQPTAGAAPCYVSCDPAGRWLLVANYSSGNLAVYLLEADGSLWAMSDNIQHIGALGPNTARQERAHAHSIRFDPSGNFVLAADLGLDRIFVYRQDAQSGRLFLNEPPGGVFSPGAGPRHFEFSVDGRFAYVANELDSTVVACTWDNQFGLITPIQTLSTLPPGFSGENAVADIHRTPDGNFLYISNRGHNSLAIFAVDRASGLLEARGHVPVAGEWPRNFAIDPSGSFVYVANQFTNNIVAFRLDSRDGSLEPMGHEVSVPSPVCVLFADG
jgi:6-phosphogluconolactonase